MNITHLLASTYSFLAPGLNTAAASCMLNGEEVACPQWFEAVSGGSLMVFVLAGILMIAAIWRVYTKAGQPGWAAIVPVYNMVVMLRVVRKPTWWVLLTFVPIVNIVIAVIVANQLARAFGKGIGYSLGLIFLPFIFYPILGFGKASYQSSPPPAPAY